MSKISILNNHLNVLLDHSILNTLQAKSSYLNQHMKVFLTHICKTIRFGTHVTFVSKMN